MDARTLCLGVLARGDASGYEIKKAFEEGPFPHIHATSFGSIYPALNKLTDEGLVDCAQMAQDKRPDKKVYSLTDAGHRVLVEQLSAPPTPDRMRSDFLFIVFFAHHLPADLIARLIDQRIAWYRTALERMEACAGTHLPPGERLVHGLGLAVYRAAAGYLEEGRGAFLDELAGPARLVAE